MLSVFALINNVETCKASGGNTIYVDKNGGKEFTKIQDAINATESGDTVYVYGGEYNENIVINKAINLRGDNKDTTVIDGSKSGAVISIYAEDASVSGFTIRNSGSNYYEAGICINSNHNTISENNICFNNHDGIWLYRSSNNVIRNNNITNNSESGVAFLPSSNYNNIINNIITSNSGGIWLSDSSNNNINQNTITKNGVGISFGDSSNNTISANTIADNYDSGIWHSGSSENNVFSGNNIKNSGRYGISMSISSKATITGNTFENSGDSGINLEQSSYDTITDNSFVSDGISINGEELNYWNTHIIENNKVNEKSIYYYKNNHEGLIVPSDAGQIILTNCSNFTIQNFNMKNVKFGIQLGWSSYNIISGNTITNTSDNSIYLINSFNNLISNNYIEKSRRYGIDLIDSSKNTITENNISDCNWGGIYGSGSSNKININYLLNNGDLGIQLGGALSQNNTISMNTILEDWICIHIVDSSNNRINDNTIRYTKNYPSPNSYGIELENSSDNSITRNNITNKAGNGIGLLPSCENNIISNNNITQSQYSGIFVWSSSNNIFTKNIIIDGKEEGVSLYDSSNKNNISGNIITRSSGNGICLKQSSNENIMSQNEISYSNNSGINLSGASNNTISDNKIINNKYGIYLYEESTNSLFNNPELGIPISYPEYKTSNNNIINNTITNNEIGIFISINTKENYIANNIFLNDSKDVQNESEVIKSETKKFTETIFYIVVAVFIINVAMLIYAIGLIRYTRHRGRERKQEAGIDTTFEKNIVKRPAGISILTVLEGFDGVYSLMSGIPMALGLYFIFTQGTATIPPESGEISMNFFLTILALLIFAIIFSATTKFVISYGFWKGKGWAWILGIIFPIIGIISSFTIYEAFSESENLISFVASVIIGAIVILYLTRPHVKAYFGKTET